MALVGLAGQALGRDAGPSARPVAWQSWNRSQRRHCWTRGAPRSPRLARAVQKASRYCRWSCAARGRPCPRRAARSSTSRSIQLLSSTDRSRGGVIGQVLDEAHRLALLGLEREDDAVRSSSWSLRDLDRAVALRLQDVVEAAGQRHPAASGREGPEQAILLRVGALAGPAPTCRAAEPSRGRPTPSIRGCRCWSPARRR